ncbi:hypothetical protein LINGRAHAP2_LOCUS34375, partial [Linum grandiflorum]
RKQGVLVPFSDPSQNCYITSKSVEQLEFKLGIRRRNRSSFGTIWETVHYLEHNSSLGSLNDARAVALESY